jgi:uncharacterized protein DUF6263
MELKRLAGTWSGAFWIGLTALAVLASPGCKRSGVKEARITGKSSDPPVGMPVQWQTGKRYLYRLDVSTSSMVPRRTTGKPIRAETSLGADLAFAFTNAPAGESRLVDLEVLSVQMEMSHDEGTIVSFDSDNKTIPAEENPLVDRLQRLVGLRMRFQLSPDNKVTRVDGMKELNDRMTTGGNTVRGVGAEVLRRFFNQQFFRDLLEMGMFHKDPVRIGETWKETRQGNAGWWGTTAPLELTYKFRGWQRRDGTNCARTDFTGSFKPTGPPGPGPGPGPGSNQPPARVARGGPPSPEEGTLVGQTWYNPDLAVGVEMAYDQSMIKRSAQANRPNMIRRPPNQGGTNAPGQMNLRNPQPGPGGGTNPPPPPPPAPVNVSFSAVTNAPGTNVTASQWHVSFKLLEVETLQPEKAKE